MMLNECLIRLHRAVNMICAQNIHLPKHCVYVELLFPSQELAVWIRNHIGHEVFIYVKTLKQCMKGTECS